MRRLLIAALAFLLLAPAAPLAAQERMLDGFAPAAAQANRPAPDADARRICIIGNSHIGSMRKAIEDGLFFDRKLNLTFWGFPGPEYLQIKFENGRFTHPDKQRALNVSNGRFESINPKDFDVLVFVGGMSEGAAYQAANRNAGDAQVRRIIERSRAMTLAKDALADFSGRVVFIPGPLRSDTAPAERARPVGSAAVQQFDRVAEALLRESKIAFIPQPPETIGNGGTKRDYSLPNNFGHMNEQYGKVVLETLQRRLQDIR